MGINEKIQLDRVVTMESINNDCDLIAMEASLPSFHFQALTSRLPMFVADVKAFVGNILQMSNFTDVIISRQDFERVLNKVNYLALSDVVVYVPPGMNVTWEKYLDAVTESQLVVNRLREDTLDPTLRFVAQLLSQPESMQSLRGVPADIVIHDLKKIKDTIAKCYGSNSSETKTSFGKVFKRNNDVVAALERLNGINEDMAKINKTEIVETVNEISSALDKLIIRMKADPEVYKMTGITMKDLAIFTTNVAREIEYFAAHCYTVQSATTAMQDTKERIEYVLKR